MAADHGGTGPSTRAVHAGEPPAETGVTSAGNHFRFMAALVAVGVFALPLLGIALLHGGDAEKAIAAATGATQ